MKKVLATVLALAMMMAFASCGGNTDVTSSDASSATSTPSSTAPAGSSEVSSEESSEISSEEVSSPSSPADENPWNLSFKGNAYVDSVSTEYPAYTADKLNDGDKTSESRWQSNSDGNTADDGTVSPAWCGIQWDDAQTFDKVVIDWETAHPTEDGVVLEISDDGETWTKVEATLVRTGTDLADHEGWLDRNHQIDTFTFEAVTAKYVRAYCTKAYVTEDDELKTKPSCYEFEVYNTADMNAESSEAPAESSEVAE